MQLNINLEVALYMYKKNPYFLIYLYLLPLFHFFKKYGIIFMSYAIFHQRTPLVRNIFFKLLCQINTIFCVFKRVNLIFNYL